MYQMEVAGREKCDKKVSDVGKQSTDAMKMLLGSADVLKM
jgi:hypothetical protein